MAIPVALGARRCAAAPSRLWQFVSALPVALPYKIYNEGVSSFDMMLTGSCSVTVVGCVAAIYLMGAREEQ